MLHTYARYNLHSLLVVKDKRYNENMDYDNSCTRKIPNRELYDSPSKNIPPPKLHIHRLQLCLQDMIKKIKVAGTTVQSITYFYPLPQKHEVIVTKTCNILPCALPTTLCAANYTE